MNGDASIGQAHSPKGIYSTPSFGHVLTPKGLHPTAQGKRSATLGNDDANPHQNPERVLQSPASPAPVPISPEDLIRAGPSPCGAEDTEPARIFRTAVIGAGRMGRLHARVYSELPQCRLVAVVDVRKDAAEQLAGQYGAAAYEGVDPILDQVDAVSVAVPTTLHLQCAEPFIERGIPCLIEKPLAESVASAAEIVELARKHNCIVAVGHIERYNPVVVALDRMGVRPKFIETHRISPFTFRSADIGVVLDMMIHDIDVVLHLTGSPVARIDAVGVNVLGPHEDIANARLAFANGCVANLTASRLAVKTERKIRVFSEQAYLSLDYQKKSGIAVKKDANLDILRLAREGKFKDITELPFTRYADMLKIEPLQIEDEEPAKREIQSFLCAVKRGHPSFSDSPLVPQASCLPLSDSDSIVTAEQGLAAVRCADGIVQAIQQHQWDGTPTGRVGLADNLITPA